MTLFRFPRRKRRMVEVEDEGSFALAIQHGRTSHVDIVIEVTNDQPGKRTRIEQFGPIRVSVPQGQRWRVVERRRERWRPQSEGGVQGIPDTAELTYIARKYGARYARVGLRAPLRISD